ncbi:MAG TPA: DUF4032 domain-containing protein [Pyrinomonadaceae bacterium]|jgi:hypothetical protein
MSTRIEFRRVAGELLSIYLKHQSRKAHEGLFTPLSFESERPAASAAVEQSARRLRRSLRQLAGVELSASEARAVWPSVLEHKWYLGERLGRDVGLRVAAVDYFENIHPAPRRTPAGAHGGLPPRLPMMMPLGQRS